MKRKKILKRIITNIKVTRHYALMLEDRMIVDWCEKAIDELSEELNIADKTRKAK